MDVKKSIPKTSEAVEQAIFGSASEAFVAGEIKVMKFDIISFIAVRTPIKSFVLPILIAKEDGKELPDAFVFCNAKNAGKRKKAVIPIAKSENTPVLKSFSKKDLKPSHFAILYAINISNTKIQVKRPI